MRQILSLAPLFGLFNTLIGIDHRSQKLCSDHIRAKPGDRILDAGCGLAELLPFLPEGVQYVGFDHHRPYIEANRKKFAGRGEFHCEDVSNWVTQKPGQWDRFLAIGVLHHLDDALVLQLLEIAKRALTPLGWLVTADGCFTDNQDLLTRAVLKSDRGRFVRTQEQYERLARQVFPNVRMALRSDLLRIPHTALIMECC